MVEDEQPEQMRQDNTSDYHFIFIVDRSGSMGFGSNRIALARDALSIFIRSLPIGCKFSIISFGSRFEGLQYNNVDFGIEYNESSKDFALEKIQFFDSDFGGTEMLGPLKHA